MRHLYFTLIVLSGILLLLLMFVVTYAPAFDTFLAKELIHFSNDWDLSVQGELGNDSSGRNLKEEMISYLEKSKAFAYRHHEGVIKMLMIVFVFSVIGFFRERGFIKKSLKDGD